jgi:hypothetical protein
MTQWKVEKAATPQQLSQIKLLSERRTATPAVTIRNGASPHAHR